MKVGKGMSVGELLVVLTHLKGAGTVSLTS